MPGVQHDAHARVLNAGEDVFGQLRVGEPEPRPPLVFDQEVKGGLYVPKQVVDELDGGVQHLRVRMQPAVGIALLQRDVGHMEHHVGRFQPLPHGEVLLEMPQQVLRRFAAINLLDHLPGAELAEQLCFVLPPEIHPVHIEGHVKSGGEIIGEVRHGIIGIVDRFDAVQAQGVYLFPQGLPTAVLLDAVARNGKIDGLDHNVPFWVFSHCRSA